MRLMPGAKNSANNTMQMALDVDGTVSNSEIKADVPGDENEKSCALRKKEYVYRQRGATF